MRRLLLTLLAALALALAACGGESDEDEIRDLVSTFYANEEGVCDAVTESLLSQEFESKEDCETQAEDAEPQEGWEIEDISTDGDEGEVDIRVEDQQGTLLVKREDGEWKVDGIRQREADGEPPAETAPAPPAETAPDAPSDAPPGLAPDE